MPSFAIARDRSALTVDSEQNVLALVVEHARQVADRGPGRGRVQGPVAGGDAFDRGRDVLRFGVFGQEPLGVGASDPRRTGSASARRRTRS